MRRRGTARGTWCGQMGRPTQASGTRTRCMARAGSRSRTAASTRASGRAGRCTAWAGTTAAGRPTRALGSAAPSGAARRSGPAARGTRGSTRPSGSMARAHVGLRTDKSTRASGPTTRGRARARCGGPTGGRSRVLGRPTASTALGRATPRTASTQVSTRIARSTVMACSLGWTAAATMGSGRTACSMALERSRMRTGRSARRSGAKAHA
mmetsp:Transcript_34633/g.98602  ORF Transcript_34633/g.98602 Transcript_34633/m.98602 type:complete len:210 (+) Transcript_34633:480-1109(+)